MTGVAGVLTASTFGVSRMGLWLPGERAVRNGRIGRRLAGLAERSGLAVDRVVPVTAVFRDVREADQVLGLARVARRAVEAGYLRERAEGRWTEHLATQPFFASVTLFVVVVDRPRG